MSLPLQKMSASVPLNLGRFPARTAPRAQRQTDGLTWTGALFFVTALTVAFSAFKAYRVSMGSLEVHVYLMLIAPMFLFMLLMRLGDFPRAPLIAMTLFTIMFAMATMSGQGALAESAKMISGTATIVTVALMTRSEKDFRWGVVGLMGAVTFLSVYGFLYSRHKSMVGINPLEVANENAFSLYTLPPLLLSGYIAIDKSAPKWMRIGLLACIFIVLVAMFSNANRSGWLCAALSGGLLLWRGKSVWEVIWVAMMVASIAIAGAFFMEHFGDTELFWFRLQETWSSHSTDKFRWELFLGCVDLGLENPVMGVGPQNVAVELSSHVHTRADSHNVYGYIIGGAGVVSMAIFLYLGWTLYRKPQALKSSAKVPPDPLAVAAHRLLRMMLILWAVRGAFSREILYTPGFCLGLGLVIGLCIVQGVWRERPRRLRAGPAAVGQFAT